MKSTYKIRLTILLSIILISSFIGISYFNYKAAQIHVREEIANSSLPLTQENLYSDLIKDLIPPLNIASLMSNDTFLIEWTTSGEKDTDKIIDYLKEIENKYHYFSAFFISETTGNYYHYSGVLKKMNKNDPHDIWYYDFISSEKKYEVVVDTNEANGNKLTIFINFRVEDMAGMLLGVTGVGLEMRNFSDFLSEKQKLYHRTIFLVDRSGLIQAHSDMKFIEKVSLYDQPGIGSVAGELLLKSEVPVDNSYSVNGSQVLVTSRYIKELGWFLIVEENESEALKTARYSLYRTLIAGLGTSLIIIILSAFTVNYYQKKLETIAVTDNLTHLYNRRELNKQFEKALYRYNRYKTEFSIIIIDIDKFKDINDSIGHLSGDKLLVRISEILLKNIRPTDFLARWGGDEFVIIAECQVEEARQTAERIRAYIQNTDFSDILNKKKKITISAGVAEYTENETVETFLSKADKTLYKAKENGRNKVCFYQRT